MFRDNGFVDANNQLSFVMFCVPNVLGYAAALAVSCQRSVSVTKYFTLGQSGTLTAAATGTLELDINGITAIHSVGALSIAWTDVTAATTQNYQMTASGNATLPDSVDEISSVSESLNWNATLPYVESFPGTLGHFKVIRGSFILADDEAPDDPEPGTKALSTETPSSVSQQNIALWSGFDHTTVGRVYTAAIKLLPGSAQSNGGLLLNWLPSGNFSGQWVYFVVQLNYLTQQFAILYFNGSQLVSTTAVAQLTNLQQNRWYQIQVTTTDAGDDNVTLTAVLTGLGGFTLSATLSLTTSSYYPASGQVGFIADRSVTRFSFLDIAES
jgi:hypothetical protein